MEAWIGTSLPVFIAITVVIIGFCAFMAGQGVANAWGGIGEVAVYCIMLGGASRFLIYGLFDGELFSLSGYVIDVVVLFLIAGFAHRFNRARRFVRQYPWLYERVGLFGYRRHGPR